MKRLMISVHPEWVEKILNGEKTIEVRPWIPKGVLPLEVLIYCTKSKYDFHVYKKDGAWTLTEKRIQHYPYKNVCGKVVAKFTLNKVDTYDRQKPISHKDIDSTCIDSSTWYDLATLNDILCFWHIENLVIFDEPKELGEFYHYKKKLIDCGMDCPPYVDEVKVPLTKAPQKMVWVEE